MRSKIVFIICMFFFLQSIGIFAYDWEDKGIKVLQELTAEPPTNRVILEENGQSFELIYSVEPDDKTVDKIIKLKNQFYSFSYLKIKKINFVLSASGSVYVAIIPKEFKYKGRDLTKYLPGGLGFFDGEYKDSAKIFGLDYIYKNKGLYYNFRILRGDRTYKLNGLFKDEEKLIRLILDFIDGKKAIVPQKEKVFDRELEEKRREKEKKREKEIVIAEKKVRYLARDTNNHSLRFYMGSGALFSVAYGYMLFKEYFEVMPYAGVSLFSESEDSKDDNPIGTPLGARFNLYLYNSMMFRPYIFAGGSYIYGVQDMDPYFLLTLGAGQILFQNFLVEATFMMDEDSDWEFGVGFGLRFTL